MEGYLGQHGTAKDWPGTRAGQWRWVGEPKALLGLSSIIYTAQSVTSREVRVQRHKRGRETWFPGNTQISSSEAERMTSESWYGKKAEGGERRIFFSCGIFLLPKRLGCFLPTIYCLLYTWNLWSDLFSCNFFSPLPFLSSGTGRALQPIHFRKIFFPSFVRLQMYTPGLQVSKRESRRPWEGLENKQ